MRRKCRTLLCLLVLCLVLAQACFAQPLKLIALTFDDGPDNDFTPQILDLLKDRGAKATFFCLGAYLVDKGPVLNRTLEEGHQLGSHTFDHIRLNTLSNAEILDQLGRLTAALREKTGRPDGVYWLRPPYGKYNQQVCDLAGVPLIHWSIDPAEGKTVAGEKMAQIILKKAFDGAIILLHDTTQNNVDAVGPVLDGLLAQGYEFVTVDELFRLKGVIPQAGAVYRKVTGPDPLAFDEKGLAGHWAWPYISYLRDRGLMAGDASGFHPNHPLTRAMAVTLLWRLEGTPPSAHNPGFGDVAWSAWYRGAVSWGVQNGLIQGRTAATFDPDGAMTREEFYALLARLARLDYRAVSDVAPEIPSYQDDRRTHPWAREDVVYLRQLGFVSDYDVELFRPLAQITRAEAAELLTWYLTG